MSARRAACIESCSSSHVAPRDTSCVNDCKSKRKQRRKRVACIERCPISSETNNDAITLNSVTSNQSEADYQTMDLSAYSKNDTSNVNFDPLSYVPLEDLASKTESRNGKKTGADRVRTKSLDSFSNSSHDVGEYWQNETRSSNESTLNNNDGIMDNENEATASDLFNVSKEMIEATFIRSINLAFEKNSLNDEIDAQTNDDAVGTPSKVNELPHTSMVPTNAGSISSKGNFTSHQNKSSSLDIVSDNDDLSQRHRECVNSCTKKRTLQRKRDACLERCRVLENQTDIKSTLNDSSNPVSILARGRGSVKFEL